MRKPLLAILATLCAVAVVSPARAGATQAAAAPTTTTSTAPSSTEKPAAKADDCSKKGHAAADHKCAHGAAMKDGEHTHMSDGSAKPSAGKVTEADAKTAGPAPAKPSTAVTYVCPMHPEVTSDKKSRCPKCNMFLEPKK